MKYLESTINLYLNLKTDTILNKLVCLLFIYETQHIINETGIIKSYLLGEGGLRHFRLFYLYTKHTMLISKSYEK